ncbi:hypothetical protein EON65_21250 [archaeon]|nr:MAG: hypothetical protein EON65_21250 [archaeon]
MIALGIQELQALLEAPVVSTTLIKVDPSVRKAIYITADKIVNVQGLDVDSVGQRAKEVLFHLEDGIETLVGMRVYNNIS